MQKTKKFLSELIAVVMIISVFTFGASAGVTDLDETATENIAMKLEVEHADGTVANTVSPGETITVKVYVTAKDVNARVYGGAFLCFFNDTIYEFVTGSRQWGVGGTTGGTIDNAALMSIINSGNPYTLTTGAFTETEKAYGWNKAANIQVKNAPGTVNTNAPLIKNNAGTPFLTYQLKVLDNAVIGANASVGIPTTSIAPLNTTRANYTYIQTWTDSNVRVTQNKSKSLYVMDTIRDLTVASATPTPTYKVEKAKSEALFTGDKSTGTPDDLFTYRLKSKVSAADLAAMTSNGNKIEALGFIAANKGTTGLDEAKAAVEAGTALPAGWETASTDYISQADASSEAFFGCRIQNISHAAQDTDITCAAYVAYSDGTTTHYVWYAAPENAAVSSGYNAAVALWAAQA